MQNNLSSSVWGVRLITFAVSVAAAASAAYWGLKVWGISQPSRSGMPTIASAPPVDPQALAKVFGGGAAALVANAAAPATSSQYALVGVVADNARGGAALIAVDGNPAKPYRVGAAVDGRLLLQSVTLRNAVLATAMDAPAEVALELKVPEK